MPLGLQEKLPTCVFPSDFYADGLCPGQRSKQGNGQGI